MRFYEWILDLAKYSKNKLENTECNNPWGHNRCKSVIIDNKTGIRCTIYQQPSTNYTIHLHKVFYIQRIVKTTIIQRDL